MVKYRKSDGTEAAPNTMKSYVFGIQRYFLSNWGYKLNLTTGPVFGCEKVGLYQIMDKLFAHQQHRGMTVKSHNVLTSDNIRTIYNSEQLSQGFFKVF